MPSLVKYFAFVGAALLALLTLSNFLLEPSTGTRVVAAQPKSFVVQHDPRASKVERWRDEQAALKAEASQPKTVAKTPTEPAPATIVAKAAAPSLEPAIVQPAAPAALPATPPAPVMQAADASANIEGVPTEAERAAKTKRKKAEAARKKRLAQARAKSRELADSSRQDQLYYGQRAATPPFGQQQAYAPAPRQDFGPFGWGRGW